MEKIITDVELLRTPAEPLTFLTDTGAETTEGEEIVNKLIEVMEADSALLALSAPQIGINKRIFCLRFNDQIKTFINPIITKKAGLVVTIETSASMPGKEIVIGRPEELTAVYYNAEFKYEENKLLGVAASLFDQQAQFLDGVVPSDLGLVSDIAADGKIEESDMESIIPFYKDTFLPNKLKAITDLIGDSEEAKDILRNLKFTEGVINGRITVVESEKDTKTRLAAKKAANKTILGLSMSEKQAKKQEFKKYVSDITKKSRK